MSLEIYQSAFTAHQLESAIAGGRAPWADGLTEFPLEAYTVRGADLQSIGDTVAQKAEVEAPAWPEGFQSAANLFVKVYFSPYGVPYVSDIVSHCTMLGCTFSGAEYLRSLELPAWNPTGGVNTAGGQSGVFESPGLERLLLPRLQSGGHYWARRATGLKTCQLGSVGYPVTNLGLYFFQNCTQRDLTVTVYVDAATLADIPVGVVGNAPWGATNATIIYRNSTTGEVITE